MMLDTKAALLMPLAVLALLAVVAVVVVVVVLIVRSAKRGPAPEPALPSSGGAPPDGEERQAVLKKLAAGELTREQAEAQLEQLGTPVPAGVAEPPPRKSGGKGCLIAVVVTVLLLPLLVILLALTLFGVHWKVVGNQREQMLIHQDAVRSEMQISKRALRPDRAAMTPLRPEEVRR